MKTVLLNPMPMPITNDPTAAHNGPSAGVSATSIAHPITIAKPPRTATRR